MPIDGLFYGQHETVEVPASGPAAANDATARNPIGCLLRHSGKVYRYVKFDNGTGNVASAAGGVALWKTLTPASGVFTVTSDVTDNLGGANGQAVAGIFLGVITDLHYCWIQVGGPVTAKTAANTAAGDGVTGSSTDLVFGRLQNGQNFTGICYGVALDTRHTTDGTNTVLLQNLIW